MTNNAAVEAEFSRTRTDMDLRSRENSNVKRREKADSMNELRALTRAEAGSEGREMVNLVEGAAIFSTRTLRAASVGSPTQA